VTLMEVRVPPDLLSTRVEELARDITDAYRGTRPVLVTVLRGGTFFLADLVRRLGLDVEVDFLAMSPYGAGRTARVIKDLDRSIAERHVLVIEDIVDTGLTLTYLLRTLAERRPASLRVCALLDRSVRRIAEVPLDWVGFEVGDEFLVGYGLDINERLRQVPAVLAVADRAGIIDDPEGHAAAALARAGWGRVASGASGAEEQQA
jgi:hypoxanthine phosphoribosyltransferase